MKERMVPVETAHVITRVSAMMDASHARFATAMRVEQAHQLVEELLRNGCIVTEKRSEPDGSFQIRATLGVVIPDGVNVLRGHLADARREVADELCANIPRVIAAAVAEYTCGFTTAELDAFSSVLSAKMCALTNRVVGHLNNWQRGEK